MTLVVARITDLHSGRVSLLADTMFYDFLGDETANRQVLSKPGQKVVIVNDNIVVGYAGDNPQAGIREIVQLREREYRISELVEHLSRFSGANSRISRSFLVVARQPEPRLWRIVNGRCEERTQIRQTYVGDDDAYNRYRTYTQAWDNDYTTDEFRLVSSMQSVVNMADLPSVGGYVVRATGSRTSPFRFHGDPAIVGPWFTNASVQKDGKALHITLTPPDGIDPTMHTRLDIPGTGSTFSALVHVIPQSGVAWMHTHETPWEEPVRLPATNPLTLVKAAAQHRQQLEMPCGTAAEVLNGVIPGAI